MILSLEIGIIAVTASLTFLLSPSYQDTNYIVAVSTWCEYKKSSYFSCSVVFDLRLVNKKLDSKRRTDLVEEK